MQFLFLLLFVSRAECRWATLQEAEYRVVQSHVVIDVATDGKETVTMEREIEILKEGARREEGIYRETYNSRASHVRVLEAWADNHGQRVPVDPRFIEDKPLASNPSGFDQWNQLIIAFPQVDIGSKLYLKIREEEQEIPFDNYSFDSFTFGFNSREDNAVITIHSKKKLFYAANDPRKELNILVTDDAHSITLSNKKPVYYQVLEETRSVTPLKEIPWVDVSTHENPMPILDLFIEKYEDRLKASLPPMFQEIREEAKQSGDFFDQVDAITNGLQKRTHYLGDWRPIRGGFIPRSLEEIANTRFGDCKDFAVSTVAILRSLGYKAQVAFVYRGALYIPRPTSMPSLTADYNHAIVHVEKEGKDFWFDPTNQVSFAHGIFPDIANRPGLILEKGNPHFGKIPAIAAEKNHHSAVKEIQFVNRNLLNIKASIALHDTAAIPVTAIELSKSKKESEFYLLSWATHPKEVKNYQFEPFDLTNRTVKDKEFSFVFTRDNFLQKTSLGYAFIIWIDSVIEALLFEIKDRVSDLHIRDIALEFEDKSVLQNTRLVGKRSLGCAIESPWLDAKRLVRQVKKDIEISNMYKLKNVYITQSEIHSDIFKKMQAELRECFRSSAVMIDNSVFPAEHR